MIKIVVTFVSVCFPDFIQSANKMNKQLKLTPISLLEEGMKGINIQGVISESFQQEPRKTKIGSYFVSFYLKGKT